MWKEDRIRILEAAPLDDGAGFELEGLGMTRHDGGKHAAKAGATEGTTHPQGRMPRGEMVREIMTPRPETLEPTASVMDAAERMRDKDIGTIVVLEQDRLCGILTDRDIVVRVLAQGSDPAEVKVGDVCSRDLTTIAPTASLGEAVRLVREKAIRRLVVVEDGGPVVGIVSLGDMAVARDRKSALGEISSAEPNT
jgi:CBS domain-containing protein